MILNAISANPSPDWAALTGQFEVVGAGEHAICVLPTKVARAMAQGEAALMRAMALRLVRQSVDVVDAVAILETAAILRRSFPQVVKAGVRLGRGMSRRGASRTKLARSSARATD